MAIDIFRNSYDVSTRPVEVYTNSELPVPILQGKWEFERLLGIYKARAQHQAPWSVLEIGSLYGGTLWHWMKYAKPGSEFVCVDQLVNDNDARYDLQMKCHREMWPAWAAEHGHGVAVLEGDSTDPELIKKVSGNSFDFIFIDGGHSYDVVKADFENYGRLAKPGGMIVLHDILFAPWWGSIEVHRLWGEIVQAGYVVQEFYSKPDQYFLEDRSTWGIGIVYV